MKKILSLVAVMMLLGAVAVYGQAIGELKGKMAVGGFLNYGMGLGDAFKDYEIPDLGQGFTAKYETSLGLSFGGRFVYGMAPKMALAGIFDYQTITSKVTMEGEVMGISVDESESNTESWMEISANGMYFFSPENKMCPYLEAGPGFYIPSVEGADSKLGINAGVGAIYMINEKMALDFGGRFHMIFTDVKKTNYIDIHAGVSFFLGGE